MLVIITQRYDSSVLKQKVYPTKKDAKGNPMYAIYLDDDRAQVLINAGVAEEYVTENLIVGNSNNDVITDPDANEGNTDSNSKPEDSNADDNIGGNANDKDLTADDSKAI